MPLKSIGTQVPISTYNIKSLTKFLFPDEEFGVYAYQAVSATIDSATFSAFVNGNLVDLQNIASTNGIQVDYLQISWNETPSGNSVIVKDLSVGVVAHATSAVGITAQNLLTALSRVSWYNNVISKLVMPWQVYGLIQLPASAVDRWEWDAVASEFELRSLSGTPSPPAVTDVLNEFTTKGGIDAALGKWVMDALNQGVTVTLVPPYDVHVCFELMRTWQSGNYTYARYRTHTRLGVNFSSVPEINEATGRLIVWTAPVVAKLIEILVAIIVAGIVAAIWVNNLTTEHVEIMHKITYRIPPGGSVTLPNGQVITNNGDTEMVVDWLDTYSYQGPPAWWGWVIAVVAIGISAMYILPKALGSKKEGKK